MCLEMKNLMFLSLLLFLWLWLDHFDNSSSCKNLNKIITDDYVLYVVHKRTVNSSTFFCFYILCFDLQSRFFLLFLARVYQDFNVDLLHSKRFNS